MGADYSFYVKIIETHARAFIKVIIFSIGSVTAFRGLFPKVFTNLLHGTALGGTNTIARGVVDRVTGDNFYGPHGRYNRTFNFTLT